MLKTDTHRLSHQGGSQDKQLASTMQLATMSSVGEGFQTARIESDKKIKLDANLKLKEIKKKAKE